MDEEEMKQSVPTGNVQLEINNAIIDMLDPSVDRNTYELQLEKIRAAKELNG